MGSADLDQNRFLREPIAIRFRDVSNVRAKRVVGCVAENHDDARGFRFALPISLCTVDGETGEESGNDIAEKRRELLIGNESAAVCVGAEI